MVSEIFIANYNAEAERDGNRQPFIAFVHASGRQADEVPNSFEGEAWCDSIAVIKTELRTGFTERHPDSSRQTCGRATYDSTGLWKMPMSK
jgi:hypothetical protein